MNPFLAAADPDELKAFCRDAGFPAFRASQISSWLHGHYVTDPAAMKNLPGEVKQALAAHFIAPGASTVRIASGTDGVEKLLLDLRDGERIEMVILPGGGRTTFCLSTQVGCPVGCLFCASGRGGLIRNLAAGEMLEEFCIGALRAGRPDNLVFMGIGEGLLNFDALALALSRLTGEFAFSPRRITVSTSGYVPGMKRFASLKKEYNLAVSLHAPDDATRARLIPARLRYPIAEILDAADMIREANNRQYTLEYTLVAGINDSVDQAKALGRIACAHHAKVNLIPYNETGGVFRRPAAPVIDDFENAVASVGARVTRRVERGTGETAACGQLRAAAKRDPSAVNQERKP